jgi:hypothetical protein
MRGAVGTVASCAGDGQGRPGQGIILVGPVLPGTWTWSSWGLSERGVAPAGSMGGDVVCVTGRGVLLAGHAVREVCVGAA